MNHTANSLVPHTNAQDLHSRVLLASQPVLCLSSRSWPSAGPHTGHCHEAMRSPYWNGRASAGLKAFPSRPGYAGALFPLRCVPHELWR